MAKKDYLSLKKYYQSKVKKLTEDDKKINDIKPLKIKKRIRRKKEASS